MNHVHNLLVGAGVRVQSEIRPSKKKIRSNAGEPESISEEIELLEMIHLVDTLVDVVGFFLTRFKVTLLIAAAKRDPYQ